MRGALARVGKWIVDRGTVENYAGVPDDLPEAELAPFLGEMDAPDGRIRYLKPVLGLSATRRSSTGRRPARLPSARMDSS